MGAEGELQPQIAILEKGFWMDKTPVTNEQYQHFLKENPKHRSLQIHKLQGTDFWEFYVDKGYRCVFKTEGNIFRLFYIGTHGLIDRF